MDNLLNFIKKLVKDVFKIFGEFVILDILLYFIVILNRLFINV